MNDILERRKLEKAVELTNDEFSVEDAEVDSEPEIEVEEENDD